MTTLEINQLYHYSRFPESPSKLFLLLLYTPIGILLCFIRTILALSLYLLSFILPNIPALHNVVHRLICIALGIIINVENVDKREEADVFISNKVSYFDAIVINSLTKCITPGVQINSFLSSALGFRYFTAVNDIELKKCLENILYHDKIPIYFQPESVITNGKVLLKFTIWPFTICNKVQPVTLKIYRPGLEIPITTIDSTYWSDIFYFMFVPCTVYKVKFLCAVEKKGLLETNFVDRIRQNIATDLQIELSNYSASDVQEYVKRYRAEQRRNFTATSTINPQTHQMSMQVQEVFPLVPYDAIYKDLIKTQSVDQTITNILEGHVQYTLEQPTPSVSLTTTHKKISTPSPNINSTSQTQHRALSTAAHVFGKSPQERNQSFQERKRLLIENSRRRYLEKSGLNIVGS